jgi:DNA-binding HxlR family transcriptional regulator
MPSARQERAGCPLYTAIGVIEGRWKPMLYQRLAEGPCGFGALHRALPGVSRKVLTEQLRQMEQDDLLARREIGDPLGSVRYALTPYGATLEPVFRALWEWGVRHLARADAGRGTLVRAPRTSARPRDAEANNC